MSIKQKLIIIPGLAVVVFLSALTLTWGNARYQLHVTHAAHGIQQLSLHLQGLLRGTLEARITEGSEESIRHARVATHAFDTKLSDLLAHPQAMPNWLQTALRTEIPPRWQAIKADSNQHLKLGIYLDPHDEDTQMALGRLLAEVDELLILIRDLGDRAQDHAAQVHRAIYQFNAVLIVVILVALLLGFIHLYVAVATPINRLRALVGQVPEAAPLEPDHLARCRQGLRREFTLSNRPHEKIRNEIPALVQAVDFMLANIERHIRERAKGEEALRRSQAMLRLVIDHIPEYIYWKDQHSIYQGCSVNYARMAGMANPLEIHGKSDFDLNWSQSEAKTLHADDARWMETGEIVLRRLEEKPQGEQSQWLEVSKIPMRDADGAIIGLLVCKEDITERKRMELALQQESLLLEQRVKERTAALSKANEQLSRLAKAKDEFLAAMSHELRTPLTAILGLSESLLEQVHGPVNEKQLKYLQTIEESGQHLLSLINDILDVAKVESGKMELQLGEVDINMLCQACLRMITQPARQKRLKVQAELSPDLGEIIGDNRRLKQILVNLLGNAVKFTPEGGEIGLAVERDEGEGVARFLVWDTGIGIARENHERLFMPFVQLDSRLARKYGGTGLGLALVYRMTEMHGGSVQVDSEPERGSRFTVTLPLEQEDARLEATMVPSGHEAPVAHLSTDVLTEQRRRTTVLVAEDNEENIHAIVDYLQIKGYQTVIARDGRQAVDEARTARPQLILMDIQMPNLDGLEAIRHIRAEHGMRHIPIIALTALAMPGDKERCLAAGATAYLSKPVHLHRLTQLIDSHIQPWQSRH